jgi:hypothetical protein
MNDKLNIRQKILVTAAELPADGFSTHALAAAAWRRFPESFSLDVPGESLPNSNAVIAKLSGLDGIVARGWLVRIGEGTYQVTARGRREAAALGAAVAAPVVPPKPPPAPRITASDAASLRALLASDAVRANARGGAAITPAAAEAFWRAGGGREATGDLLDRVCDPRAILHPDRALDDRGRLMQLRTLHQMLVARHAKAVAA